MEPRKLMDADEIVTRARKAKESRATRFCLGAAWRSPTDGQIEKVCKAVRAIADLGIQTCVTLGMITAGQAARLAAAGLHSYNHNLDTSPDSISRSSPPRTYADRLETLANVRAAGIRVCCGGIVGMGESRADRAGLLAQLAVLDPHPESVPVNLLVWVPGTPRESAERLDGLELAGTIAAARIMMLASVIRLSAGRTTMTDELQALCLHAGANSIFLGERLLITANPGDSHDTGLLSRLDSKIADSPLLG